MPDIPPVPPGIREIDPDAEAARLAEARKRPERTAIFAGFLSFGDYACDLAAKTVSIDVVRGAALNGPARSARPFAMADQPWLGDLAGKGAEDLGREFARTLAVPAADAAGLPGDALEAWALPITTFRNEYLITPAGEWPPVVAS